MQIVNNLIKQVADEALYKLEEHFKADVIFYHGAIHPSYEKNFRNFIEALRKTEDGYDKLVIILSTSGGSAETVEKMVDIIRWHYEYVSFVVPDQAMSAGTILCMSGDEIYMDYSSSLGPIDPQVFNGTQYVPALGYLNKVDELIKKSKDGIITPLEFSFLQNVDLALLKSYEQARELTITLLKRWLVKYKFKNWHNHSSTGDTVYEEEKEARATEIAMLLGDNTKWHSHGRKINIETLQDVIRLKIEDYSNNPELMQKIRFYNEVLIEHISNNKLPLLLHSRVYF